MDEINKVLSIFFFILEKMYYKFLNIDDILLCLELIDWKKLKKKKIFYRKKLDYENGLFIVVMIVMEYRRELGNDYWVLVVLFCLF